MIQQLKKALKASVSNPMYLYYLWKNIHMVRDHLPSLYQSLIRRRALDLGGKGDVSKLHIVMRTTDCVMNLNSSRKLEDIGISTKSDVIRVGGCSVFPAVKRFMAEYGTSVRITLVTDRLSEKGLAQYRRLAIANDVTFDVVESNGHGNGASFQTQLSVALEDVDGTLELFLEDDYLLAEDSLVVSYAVFRDHSNVIGLNPHFHPDRVRHQDIGKLCTISNRLYCRVFSTCCTFSMPVRQMRQFETYLRLYDGWEDGSVNVAWKRGVCLAPLGWTMAEHLHRSDLSPVSNISQYDFERVNAFSSEIRKG